MLPLKITIPGKYWDTFIYKGRLYIFGLNGDIRSILWEELIQSWNIQANLKIAFDCAFLKSDYLYSHDVRDLVMDIDIRNLMKSKFIDLSKIEFQIDKHQIEHYQKGQQDNPCPFPHADIEIYKDKLYTASPSGLYQTGCNKKTKYPISTRISKRWDGPVMGLSASYETMALAAGSEGLFQVGLGMDDFRDEGDNPSQLSTKNCRDCGWAYYSVFGSSDNSGFLAMFNKDSDRGYDKEAKRHFERIEDATNIFGSDGYSWGTKDKLCQASSNQIKVVKYAPWEHTFDNRIQYIGTVNFDPWKGSIISAGTAIFGLVVELEHAIVVFPSLGEPITLPGEPINWRVFPRSKHYENHLHITYEDRIEILSFNQDYLVNQENKVLGTSVFSGQRQGRYSNNQRGL